MQADAVIELKKQGVDIPEDDEKVKKNQDENVAEAFLTPAKAKKGKSNGKIQDGPTVRKAFKDEEDEVAEVLKNSKKGGSKKVSKDSQDDTLEKSEERKDSSDFNSKKKKKAKIHSSGDSGYINNKGEWIEGSVDADGENNDRSSKSDDDDSEENVEAAEAKKRAENDILEQQMIAKYEEEKEVMEFVK